MEAIRQIPSYLRYTLLYIITALATLILIIVWLPCFIYKQIVILWVKTFKSSEFREIVDPLGTNIADLGISDAGLMTGILRLKGKLTYKRLLEIVQKNLLDEKITEDSTTESRYHKLRYTICSFMGYWFLKLDPHFNIENHVKETYHFGEYSDDSGPSLESISNFMMSQPLHENTSPWDITLIANNNPSSDTSVIVVRLHHSLADGKSLFKMIVEGLGQNSFEAAKETQPKTNFNWLQFLAILPFSLVRFNMQGILIKNQLKNHTWKVNTSAENYRCKGIYKYSSEIPISKFKRASLNHDKASTSAIIMATVAGALQNFGKKHDHPVYSNGFPILCPIPKPNHPKSLENHMSVGTFYAPSNLEDSTDRVRTCQEIFCRMRNDIMAPVCAEIMMALTSTIMGPVRRLIPMQDTFAVMMTNLAGPNEEFSVGEFPCLDWCISGSPAPVSIGVVLAIFSYKKIVRFNAVGQTAVMDEKKCLDLVRMLEEEIFWLAK